MSNLKETICDINWLQENEDKIKKLLPEVWTHMHNINALKIGFGLKILGIDWRSHSEFGSIMVFLEKAGIIVRQRTYQVKASAISIFK